MSSPNRHTSLRRLTVCALFAALLCVLSPIAIPLGPIPLSLGLLGVMLTSLTLPPLSALTSVTVYVLLGICGLPVFSGGMSGAMVLVGPTGGFLWSYLLASPLISLLSHKCRSFPCALVACLLGTLICYTLGTAQYMLLTEIPLLPSLAVTVLPFFVFDMLKALVAVYTERLIRKHLPF